jgi:hypothetical protein
VAHLGDVAHPAEDAVGHARRPARTPGDLLGRLVGDLEAEDPRGAAHDAGQLHARVVLEAIRHAEAVAQRRGEEARARGGADEREGREV